MKKNSTLKEIFIQYKPFFTFLVKFVLFYLVFAFLYNLYLEQFNSFNFELDSITKLVSNHTALLMELFDQDYKILPNDTEASTKIIYKGAYVARIVEGCNAVSVIILFAAFIFAFAADWKKTALYILLGSVLVYVLNIIRISLLVVAYYYYPDYKEFLHGTVFPLFIYGVVFVLWVVWVTKFSKYAK